MDFGIILLIFVVGVVLLLAELFLPGVFIGVIGGLTLSASVALAFYYQGPIHGASLIAVSIVIIPIFIIYGLRRITLKASQNLEDGYLSSEDGIDKLIDKEGVALTLLRPAGMAKIEGKKVDVVTDGQFIQPNTPIKVILVEGNRVVVKAIGSPPQQEI